MRLHALPVSIVAVAVCAGLACSTSSTSQIPSDGRLPAGTWGGDTTGLIVLDTAFHLHVGCTFGDASIRPQLNVNGDFDVSGSYMLHAYPITVGPSVPARFTGHVDGSTVTITATVQDTTTGKTVVFG